MNPSDFAFFVLPLGVMVFLLVVGILFVVKKEEIEREKKIKRINAVLREKIKNRAHAAKQMQELNSMLDNQSIDRDTYNRLKTIVEMHEFEEEAEEILGKIWEE
jgi:hypothetical protein